MKTSNGWPIVKLGTIADVKGGKRLPKGADFTNAGYPYIRARDIRNGQVTFNDPVYIDDHTRSKIKRYTVEAGDICITIVGINIGDVGIIPPSLHHANLTENAAKVTNLADCDAAYLNVYLQSSGMKEQMQLLSSGAAQDKLGLYKIKLLDVYLPELPTQRKIAAILTAYDDLIETNKRRIALLEKMAEELYREWFVRMRFPGHQNTEFVKGVPEGWEVTPLSDLGTFLNGFAFKPSHWGSEGIPIIKIKEMNGGVTGETPRNPGDDIPSKYHFDDGAIIFSWSGTLVVMIWDQGAGLLNQHLFKVEPKKGIPHSFLFLALSFSIPLFEVLTTGATMQHIKRKELSFVKVKTPPPHLLNEFSDLVKPVLESKLQLTRANRTLTETRDLLLPRLISGKLSVEDLDILFPPSMREEATQPEPAHA